MKKTITLILAAMAASAYAEDIIFDYTNYAGWVNNANTWKEDKPTADAPDMKQGADMVEVTDGSFASTGWDGTYKTGQNVGGSVVTPNVNVGTNGSWTYTLNFTALETITTNSISVIFALANSDSGGYWSYGTTEVTYGLTLSGSGLTDITKTVTQTPTSTQGAVTLYVDWNNWSISNGSGAIVNFDLGSEQTLLAGQNYTLSLSASDASSTYTDPLCVGLGAIKIVAVPEPATATLSLLALAGLAARRRRK